MGCTIYVVSGGNGASGEQIARTALAQFDHPDTSVVLVPHVRRPDQLAELAARVASTGGIVLHTFVDKQLRRELVERLEMERVERGLSVVDAAKVPGPTHAADAREASMEEPSMYASQRSLVEIDLVGDLLDAISAQLGCAPLGRPGRYRQLRQDYFRRVEAIEFAVAHDDGCMADGLAKADVVLVGLSRTGKTPLSMVLGMRGWRAANIPLVRNAPLPPNLFTIDRRRVVGLTISAEQLLDHRRHRQRRLGLPASSAYSNHNAIFEELDYAREVFRRGRFSVLNVTHMPYEESATEVIKMVTDRAGGLRADRNGPVRA